MAWNCPVGGDWSKVDFNKAPWVIGIAEHTHEEVLFVLDAIADISVGHENDDFYIQSQFNLRNNYEKAINYETYMCIKGYNPEVNLLGIDENGIILPVVGEPEEPVEEPVGEEVIEEPTEEPLEEVEV
jgi:hypothetical protein